MAMDIYGIAPLLEVFDMPTSLHFYRDILGFEVIGRSGPTADCGWVLLKLHSAELMLNTAYDEGERPPRPDPARVASHSDTCLYFGCEDLDEAYRYLRAKGVNAKEPVVQRYGMRQLYLRDPDGFGLCFQHPASDEMCEVWRKRYGWPPPK
ncbi:MAG: VOC family protein [Bryobacteraceae bacterium]